MCYLGSLFCRYAEKDSSQFVSLFGLICFQERLLEYTQIEMEPKNGVFEPDEHWPTKGRITFDNVWMKYQRSVILFVLVLFWVFIFSCLSDQPFVLKGVSFDIPSATSLGIVGRTGSGKSSLLIALFRIVEISEVFF